MGKTSHKIERDGEMISFANDYSEGAAPEVLAALSRINFEQNTGYGEDKYSAEARKLIRAVISEDKADVHFIVGGTQTNLIMIAAALRPHEAVICVESGHVHVHETGAIEAVGHKLLPLASEDGKLRAEQVDKLVYNHVHDGAFEHMAKPKFIYISNTTELGTVYTKAEITALREVADKWNLYLYVDGARLGSALTSAVSDLSFEDYPKLCDAFSIGGTKNGMLFGEALVITNDALKEDFRYIQKQKGGMLAKGWLLGLQFKVFFEHGLYLPYARKANEMAAKLAAGFAELGLSLAQEPVSNQLFVYLPLGLHENLQKDFIYEVQNREEERVLVRFCTSWATTEGQLEAVLKACSEAQAE